MDFFPSGFRISGLAGFFNPIHKHSPWPGMAIIVHRYSCDIPIKQLFCIEITSIIGYIGYVFIAMPATWSPARR